MGSPLQTVLLGSETSVTKEGARGREWFQIPDPLSFHFSICEMGECTGIVKRPPPPRVEKVEVPRGCRVCMRLMPLTSWRPSVKKQDECVTWGHPCPTPSLRVPICSMRSNPDVWDPTHTSLHLLPGSSTPTSRSAGWGGAGKDKRSAKTQTRLPGGGRGPWWTTHSSGNTMASFLILRCRARMKSSMNGH